jgi:hypothetical protein
VITTPGAVNPKNVVVGVASAWIQPYDALIPAQLPAVTVTKGADWGGNWQNLGATDQGWKLQVGTSTKTISIEEQSTPALVIADSHSYQVTGDLAEDNLQHALWAYGGGSLVTTAAASGIPGYQTLTLQDNLNYWAIGLETINVQGFWRRYLIPMGVVGTNVDTSFRRANEKRMYSFQFEGTCAPADVKIQEMVAAALP